MRVLLVDDEPTVRAAHRRRLRRSGHQVVGEAANLAACLDLAAAEHPDVVLLDLGEGRGDGPGVVRSPVRDRRVTRR